MLALVRDPLLSRVDRRLAAILAGSVIVHIGIAIYAWSADLEEPQRSPVAAIPVEFEEVDIMIPDFTPPQQVTNGPGVAAPVAPNQTPRPIVHRPTIRPQIATNSQIDPSKLGGLFDTDDSHARAPKLDLGSQIIDARDHDVHIGTDRNPNTDRTHLGTHDETPLTSDPTLSHVDPAHHDEPHGRIIPGTVKPQSSTTLTPELVLELIQNQYMRGLQRCYTRGLASEGSLSGSVAIQFTVGANGAVGAHSAGGVSPGVDACIEGQMSTWQFPIPHDASGNATHATFAITLALQPS